MNNKRARKRQDKTDSRETRQRARKKATKEKENKRRSETTNGREEEERERRRPQRRLCLSHIPPNATTTMTIEVLKKRFVCLVPLPPFGAFPRCCSRRLCSLLSLSFIVYSSSLRAVILLLFFIMGFFNRRYQVCHSHSFVLSTFASSTSATSSPPLLFTVPANIDRHH